MSERYLSNKEQYLTQHFIGQNNHKFNKCHENSDVLNGMEMEKESVE